MSDCPEHLRYSPRHSWAHVLDDGTVRVGITDHAQRELGDVVFVELPAVRDHCTRDRECGVVESVKSTSDLYCPLGGAVTAVNALLEDRPELLNSAPYGDGWLFQLRPDDATELEQLLDAATYRNTADGS